MCDPMNNMPTGSRDIAVYPDHLLTARFAHV